MTELGGWENFYVIIGSAAGALVGLQFVVLTLIADRPIRNMAQASTAFATPTIMHFGMVLFLSAITSVPWHGARALLAIWEATGLCGAAFSLLVARRMMTQQAYQPLLSDWIYYFVLPFAAYATAAWAGIEGRSDLRMALFEIAAASLALLFTGIHNAWDAVTYHVFVVRGK